MANAPLQTTIKELASPTWLALTLINSWVAMTPTFSAPVYWVTPNGQVYLRFSMDTGTDGTVAFVLPVGARPPKPVVLIAVCDELAYVTIASNGNVILSGIGTADAANGVIFEGSFSTVA